MMQLPPEDRPQGLGLVPATPEEAMEHAFRENPPGSPWRVGYAFYMALTRKSGLRLDLVRNLVTPESLDAWGDFSSSRELLKGTSITTLADTPAPGVAYVRYPSDRGQTLRADTDTMIMVRAVATLQYRPELGEWRVHQLGEYCHPDHLPPVGS